MSFKNQIYFQQFHPKLKYNQDPGDVPVDVRLHRRLPAQEGRLPRGQVPRTHRAGMMACITMEIDLTRYGVNFCILPHQGHCD